MSRTLLVSAVVLSLGAVAPDAAKVKLELKHSAGQSSRIEATSKIHQVLNVGGMEVETAADNQLVSISTVGRRGTDGRLPIEQKVEALTIQVSLPGGVSISFDSANPVTQHDNPRVQAVLESVKARVGSTHTIVLDKENQVIAVEGAESVLRNASPAAVPILKAEINPEQMKKAAQQNYNLLSDEPVGEGDSWTRTLITSVGAGQTMTFETKFEYVGTVEKGGKRLDKIAMTPVAVTYAMENPNSQLKVTESNLKIESAKGTILFDRAKGQIVERTAATHIVGDLTLSIGGNELPGKLDLTLESSSVLK
jgi:hypothetical protein